MTDIRRRTYLRTLGAVSVVGATAGCVGDGGTGDGGTGDGGTGDGGSTVAGRFRLLISDQPVAIGDFDRLDVSFDRARIFRAGADGVETETGMGTATATEAGTATATEAGTATATEAGTATATEAGMSAGTETDSATPAEDATAEDATAEDRDGEERGFFLVDLDGATVDLTTVVGDAAVGVFDGELPEGRYAKIELYAESVDGVVDGESVDVMIPSGKLQIVKPFEVVAGETLRFVFDINVVKRGQTGRYNLLPVISESGVAGTDVDVDEVEDGGPGSSDGDGGGSGGGGRGNESRTADRA